MSRQRVDVDQWDRSEKSDTGGELREANWLWKEESTLWSLWFQKSNIIIQWKLFISHLIRYKYFYITLLFPGRFPPPPPILPPPPCGPSCVCSTDCESFLLLRGVMRVAAIHSVHTTLTSTGLCTKQTYRMSFESKLLYKKSWISHSGYGSQDIKYII